MAVGLRILVIQLRQLGDILLTTPLVRALNKALPNASIDFLAHPMGKLILPRVGGIDRCLYLPKEEATASRWLAEGKLLMAMRQSRYDVVFDFMSNPRSALLTLATGAAKRIGYQSARSFAYTHSVSRTGRTPTYIVHEKHALLAAAGIHQTSELPVLTWRQAENEPFAAAVKTAAKNGGPRVILSPTHRRPDRRWPHYGELAAQLKEQWNAEIYWLWGPGEEDFVRDFYEKSNKIGTMLPPTNFGEMIGAIGNSHLFIGNSNGPSHVAVAAGTPSFQIHGPTQLRSWCPESNEHRGIQGQALVELSLVEVWQKLAPMRELVMATASQRPAATRVSQE
jgi:ADP-heptose:LPS heptosyltransferase